MIYALEGLSPPKLLSLIAKSKHAQASGTGIVNEIVFNPGAKIMGFFHENIDKVRRGV